MGYLKNIIEKNDTLSRRIFDLFIQFQIIVPIVWFLIETLPNSSQDTEQILRFVEIGTVMIFTNIKMLVDFSLKMN